MLDTREIKKVLVVFLSIAVVLGGFVAIRSCSNKNEKEPEIQVNEDDNNKEDEKEDVVEDIPSIVEPTVSTEEEVQDVVKKSQLSI